METTIGHNTALLLIVLILSKIFTKYSPFIESCNSCGLTNCWGITCPSFNSSAVINLPLTVK